MKSRQVPLRRGQWTILILGMTLLFGLIVRLFPALLTGFPLNDGGMFLVMIRDLRANGFVLPAFTSYNLSNIPFAYPPLAFYIAGLLSWMGIPELELLRWLPILFNLGSCLAFFLLARCLLKDDTRAAAAVLIYTLVPDSFNWQIMGGGLTRALGMLMLLVALVQVYQMFQSGERRHVWFAILFCSLAILSHPEAGLAAASASMLFWIFFGRNRTGGLRSLAVAGGTILLTAFWWGSVLSAHGFTPFFSVLHSGEYHTNILKELASLLFSLNVWSVVFQLLVLGGLFWNLQKRLFLLPVWLVLPFLVEPRSAPAYAYIPSVLMAAQALTDLLPSLNAAYRRRRRPEYQPAAFWEMNGIRFLIFALAFVWLIQSGLRGFPIRNTSLLPPLPQRAMQWAADHTPADSRFLLLTGYGDSMTDPIQEWFPAMSNRLSRTTLQGQEWMLGEGFSARLNELAALQNCTQARCLEDWSSATGLNFSHVLIERNDETKRLLGSLNQNSRYELLYENEDYLIFKR